MPASVADPVQLVLRTALSGKKSSYSRDDENGPDLLEDRLAVSAKRVLHTTIEYEAAPKQQVLALDALKSKYTVLNATNHQSAKIAALNGQNNPITCQETLPAPKVTLFRYEDVKIGWKGSVPVGAGMINMGNTCYMNSTLQALLHVPSLANWLMSGRHCKNCEPGTTQLCTICIISKTLQSAHEKTGGVVKPILVYNRLKMICKHMVHGRQEDAHEFMRYLIESMEKAFLHSLGATKLDTRSKETNPLGQIFGGYIRTEVTCLKCKHISTTFQHFQDIPLDIQHGTTLEDNLNHYFRRERLEGDNAYKCDKCKSKVPATKKFSIERAPNVLCVQLKRFGLMGGKMSKHVQFPRHLNIGRFLFHHQSGATLTNACYKFVSLINHMGPSQHCGHYTAVAEAPNGQFYLFDDCSVRMISLNTVLGTGAYVLIYERVPSSSTPTPSLQNKLNGLHSTASTVKPAAAQTSPIVQTKLIPRPALISEPARPKINFELKKQTDSSMKPRLVIRNGSQPLFKSAIALGTTAPSQSTIPATEAAKSTSTATDSKNDSSSVSKLPSVSGSTVAATKPALVPYDNESGDEDDEEVAKAAPAPESASQSETVTKLNGTEVPGPSPLPTLKATESKWQVSPSPTPSEMASSTAPATNAKWQISENPHHDGSNSSSSTGSSSGTDSNWIVRSLSDTESDRTKVKTKRTNPLKPNQSISHSDTEMDPPTSKSTPTLVRLGNKIRLISESVKNRFFRPATVEVKTNGECEAPTASKNGENSVSTVKQEPADEPVKIQPVEVKPKCPSSNAAESKPKILDSIVDDSIPTSPNRINELKSKIPNNSAQVESVAVNGQATEKPSNSQTVDSTSKSTAVSKNQKWDGSRSNGVVKDLLRMSHTGFDDQVRTWDGGKSHVTKQVEDDKRTQRKRTADDIYDEEMDRGKVKKVKSDKQNSREVTPPRGTYNPFQLFQNARNRNNNDSASQQYPYKANGYHGKDKYHNQNRNQHQGQRFGRGRGRGGGGHYRNNSSDHHRSHSNHQRKPWKKFR